MNDLEKAIEIAVKSHKGQQDKSGMPYILHPLYLMMQMDKEEEKIVAVLHDVIEDTDYTLKNLIDEKFSYEIIEAIRSITKEENESYENYIDRVALNPLAKKVKLKDLEHNMDLKRLNNITEKDINRIVKRYKPAWDKLKKE